MTRSPGLTISLYGRRRCTEPLVSVTRDERNLDPGAPRPTPHSAWTISCRILEGCFFSPGRQRGCEKDVEESFVSRDGWWVGRQEGAGSSPRGKPTSFLPSSFLLVSGELRKLFDLSSRTDVGGSSVTHRMYTYPLS